MRLYLPLRLLAVAMWAGLCLPACGVAKSDAHVQRETVKVIETPDGSLIPRLGSRCYDLQVKLEKRQSDHKALPVRLAVRTSPATVGGAVKPLLPGSELLDDAFARAVRGGRAKTMFVVGQAGAGKSAFARTLQSRVCEDLPTARVDLRADVRDHAGFSESPNPVLAAAARAFGMTLKPDAEAGAHIDAGLSHKPWLLILDGLDDVTLKARPAVLGHIRAAIKAQAKMRVVILVRPPVFSPAFRLPEVAGVVELLPPSCAEIDEAMTLWQGRDSRLGKLESVLSAYKLTHKLESGGACLYRHVMTWRDLSMGMDLCRSHLQGHATVKAAGFDGSRAEFYRLWITSDLDQITKRAGVPPQTSLELIERMMQQRSPQIGDAQLTFDAALCKKVSNSMAVSSTSNLCSHLFRAHIFGERNGLGDYRFVDQSVRDWFVAYRLDMDLQRAKQPDCASISAQHAQFESSDITGFLLGMPRTRSCSAEAIRLLCRGRVDAATVARIVERGLPSTSDRGAVIAAAKAKLHTKDAVDACVIRALDAAVEP